MSTITGIIVSITPLTNTIEVLADGKTYYFKPIIHAVLSKYTIGQTFTYEGFL